MVVSVDGIGRSSRGTTPCEIGCQSKFHRPIHFEDVEQDRSRSMHVPERTVGVDERRPERRIERDSSPCLGSWCCAIFIGLFTYGFVGDCCLCVVWRRVVGFSGSTGYGCEGCTGV